MVAKVDKLASISNADNNFYDYPLKLTKEIESCFKYLVRAYVSCLNERVSKDKSDGKGYYPMTIEDYRKVVKGFSDGDSFPSAQKLIDVFSSSEDIAKVRQSGVSRYKGDVQLWRKIIENIILIVSEDDFMYDEVKVRMSIDESNYNNCSSKDFYAGVYKSICRSLDIEDYSLLTFHQFVEYAPFFTPLWVNGIYNMKTALYKIGFKPVGGEKGYGIFQNEIVSHIMSNYSQGEIGK